MSYQLDTNIQSSTVYLDSTNCISRSNAFKYSLNTAITCPPSVKMIISVQSASLPHVINNVTLRNNSFSMTYDLPAGTATNTITIPEGIYSAWSFKDYLNQQFIIYGWAITCTYDVNTFKYTFVSSYSFQILNTGTYPTTCGGIIGVSKDITNSFIFPLSSITPYWTLVMPSTINFNTSPYIFLKIANLSLSNINSHGNINDTLIRMPINCNYGEMIQYRPPETIKFLTAAKYLNEIELRLEDIYNNVLSIPSGVELQVVLRIDFMYPLIHKSEDVGSINAHFRENPERAELGDPSKEI